MKNSFKRVIKNIFLGCIVLIIVSCLLFLFLQIGGRYEKGICYERVGKEYHVSATYYAISQAIFNRAQTILVPGMDHEQVVTGLQEIAPVDIWGGGALKNGGFIKNVRLKICYFQNNNIFLLIYYTKEGKFEEVRLNSD